MRTPHPADSANKLSPYEEAVEWLRWMADFSADLNAIRHASLLVRLLDASAGRTLLGATVDAVLAHKPKAKSKPARKRARRAKKIAQAADV